MSLEEVVERFASDSASEEYEANKGNPYYDLQVDILVDIFFEQHINVFFHTGNGLSGL